MALEDQINDERERRQKLEGKLRGFAILDAGFDKGWRDVLDRTYDGPADVESVKAFAASEFGLGVTNDDNRTDDQ